MSLIRKMVRTTASNITRVLKERAQLSYEDGCLQIETHLRGVKVSTGILKVYDPLLMNL
jgi:hypothetical protein